MSVFNVSASVQVAASIANLPASHAFVTTTLTVSAGTAGARTGGTTVKVGVTVSASNRSRLPGPAGSIRSIVRSGVSGKYPDCFAQTPDGVVLIANGIDPLLRWDGIALAATDAGVPAPDAAVSLAPSGTGTGGALTGDYYAYLRYVDRFGNLSDLSPVSGKLTLTRAPGVSYSNVEVPTDNRVSRRQLLRNTAGQTTTFYVDVDTTDLTSTTFQSTLSDTALSGQTPVPLFDDLGRDSANVHGEPPSWKAVVVSHLGRMFAAGEVPYDDGHVSVTPGSAAVAGYGTAWPANFAGRVLRVAGSTRTYPILAADPATQVLTLEVPYVGDVNPFARYAVRPDATQHRLVYYTPAGVYEGWPATYALEIQEDSDEIVGLMTMSSFLYIIERNHIYRFTFKDDPATDGAVFLASLRGALSNRLWVQAEDTAYMLDERGVHAFSGGQSQPISEPIQDLFRRDSDAPLRIDWDADSTLWHAAFSGNHGTVRFFVAMTGSPLPRHALCYNELNQRWWIEEYKRPVCCSMPTRIGVERVLAGVDHREVIALEDRVLDGPRDPAGTVVGTVTGWTPLSLSDSSASFATDAANCPVFLTSGKGKGQWRRVVAVAPTRLDVDRPWLVQPDATSTYILGGIDWSWRSGYFRYADETQGDNPRDVEVLYQPTPTGAMDLLVFNDHAPGPVVWSAGRDGSAAVSPGDASAVVDLADRRGRATLRLDGHREANVPAPTVVAVGVEGVQGKDQARVFRVTIRGVEESS